MHSELAPLRPALLLAPGRGYPTLWLGQRIALIPALPGKAPRPALCPGAEEWQQSQGITAEPSAGSNEELPLTHRPRCPHQIVSMLYGVSFWRGTWG